MVACSIRGAVLRIPLLSIFSVYQLSTYVHRQNRPIDQYMCNRHRLVYWHHLYGYVYHLSGYVQVQC